MFFFVSRRVYTCKTRKWVNQRRLIDFLCSIMSLFFSPMQRLNNQQQHRLGLFKAFRVNKNKSERIVVSWALITAWLTELCWVLNLIRHDVWLMWGWITVCLRLCGSSSAGSLGRRKRNSHTKKKPRLLSHPTWRSCANNLLRHHYIAIISLITGVKEFQFSQRSCAERERNTSNQISLRLLTMKIDWWRAGKKMYELCNALAGAGGK